MLRREKGDESHREEKAHPKCEDVSFKALLVVYQQINSGYRHIQEPDKIGKYKPLAEGNHVVERGVHNIVVVAGVDLLKNEVPYQMYRQVEEQPKLPFAKMPEFIANFLK